MKVDRTQPPAASSEARGFDFPAFERRDFPNGLRLIVAHRPAVPLIDLRVLFPAGGRESAGSPPGLVGLHASLLDEGTEAHDAIALARRIESLGGSLGTGADWDVGWASIATLADHAETAVNLLADVIRRPSFPEAEIARLRGQWAAELDRRRSQPSWLASSAFLRAVYGEAPYGSRLLGTEEGLAEVTRDKLLTFSAERVRPRGATIVVTGAIPVAEAVSLVERAFGDWRDTGEPSDAVLPTPDTGRRRAIVVDRPKGSQSELILGHASVPRNHPDVPSLLVLNGLLGGKFTSRLNLILREELGVTYGVRSRFDLRRGPGPFTVSAALSTDAVGRSVEAVFGELDRLRNEPVPEQELKETRDYLAGTFPYTLQTLGGIAGRLETLIVHGLPDDHYETYPACLRDISADDVLAAAKSHLTPDQSTIVVAGPAETLHPQLEEIELDVLVIQPDEV